MPSTPARPLCAPGHIPEWWCDACNSTCFEIRGTCRGCGNKCRRISPEASPEPDPAFRVGDVVRLKTSGKPFVVRRAKTVYEVVCCEESYPNRHDVEACEIAGEWPALAVAPSDAVAETDDVDTEILGMPEYQPHAESPKSLDWTDGATGRSSACYTDRGSFRVKPHRIGSNRFVGRFSPSDGVSPAESSVPFDTMAEGKEWCEQKWEEMTAPRVEMPAGSNALHWIDTTDGVSVDSSRSTNGRYEITRTEAIAGEVAYRVLILFGRTSVEHGNYPTIDAAKDHCQGDANLPF